MTPEERESLQPEFVKSAPSQNLLGAGAANELAIQHLFEQVSLKRELHVAGMLLRRGIAWVSIAEALTWVKSDPVFVRPDPEGKLLTTRPRRGEQNDSAGGRGPRQTRAAQWWKRVGDSPSPRGRQRGTEQGGSSRSWLRGFHWRFAAFHGTLFFAD